MSIASTNVFGNDRLCARRSANAMNQPSTQYNPQWPSLSFIGKCEPGIGGFDIADNRKTNIAHNNAGNHRRNLFMRWRDAL